MACEERVERGNSGMWNAECEMRDVGGKSDERLMGYNERTGLGAKVVKGKES